MRDADGWKSGALVPVSTTRIERHRPRSKSRWVGMSPHQAMTRGTQDVLSTLGLPLLALIFWPWILVSSGPAAAIGVYVMAAVAQLAIRPQLLRRQLEGAIRQALPSCMGTGPLTPDQARALDRLDACLSAPNLLSEPERIEYAGQCAVRLIEAGEVQRAFNLMADACDAAVEARLRIGRIRWLPGFRRDRVAEQSLTNQERWIDPRVGVCGEMMLALFHALGARRFSDRKLAAPRPVDSLSQRAGDSEEDAQLRRRASIVRQVVEIVTVSKTPSMSFDEDAIEMLANEAQSNVAPTLALLGLRCASRRSAEVRPIYESIVEVTGSARLAVVSSLSPDEHDHTDAGYRQLR